MVSLKSLTLLSVCLFGSLTQAASADFYLHVAPQNIDLPTGFSTVLQFTPDGSIGLYPYCDSCYNFTCSITDEGYLELISDSGPWTADTVYLNIDPDTGLLAVNETAITDTYEVKSHILYNGGSLEWTLVETSTNHSYGVYYGDNSDYSALGTIYNSTLVPRFENGSYYLYYAADDATTTESLSDDLTHIPTSTAAQSTSTSTVGTTVTSSSSSAMAAELQKEIFGSVLSSIVALFLFYV